MSRPHGREAGGCQAPLQPPGQAHPGPPAGCVGTVCQAAIKGCSCSSGSGAPNGTAKLFSFEKVCDYVRQYRGKVVPFAKQPRFCLRVGGLEGTFHEGQDELLQWCQALYLPQPTRMAVVGTVDDVPCLATGQQLIILIAESGEVYAYEEETLHKVAKSFPEFMDIGLQLLGKEVYHCGEHIVPLDEEERDKEPAIQQIRQNVNEFIKKGEEEFHSLLDLLESKPAVAC